MDGDITGGDVAKLAIAGVSIYCPVFGAVYGVIDLGTMFFTGTGLTDRIANGIDNSIGK